MIFLEVIRLKTRARRNCFLEIISRFSTILRLGNWLSISRIEDWNTYYDFITFFFRAEQTRVAPISFWRHNVTRTREWLFIRIFMKMIREFNRIQTKDKLNC